MNTALIDAITQTIDARLLTRRQAAQLCNTSHSHLNKVLCLHTKSITIERLATWLAALGRIVEILIQPADPERTVSFPAVKAGRTRPHKPFPDIGPQPGQPDCVAAKLILIEALRRTIDAQQLTHTHAAWICGVYQSNMSKALQGQTSLLTIDRLLNWLAALGHAIEVRVQPCDPQKKTGRVFVRLLKN
jgi:predicted XRE-type DNA-binding protein